MLRRRKMRKNLRVAKVLRQISVKERIISTVFFKELKGTNAPLTAVFRENVSQEQ
jgi:hypothetical protein